MDGLWKIKGFLAVMEGGRRTRGLRDREEGRKGGRDGGREEGREEGRRGGRKEGREEGRKGGRTKRRKGGREEGMEGGNSVMGVTQKRRRAAVFWHVDTS
jgi:hypothetical protein